MKTTRLAESARLFSGSGLTIRLADAARVTIRTASPQDAGEVIAMHKRCSAESIHQRYHDTPQLTGRFLSDLLSTDVALVAEAPSRAVVALANLGRDVDKTGELAVMVEDGWQGRGIGTALVDHLVTMARLVGYDDVYTVCLPGLHWFGRALGRYGPATVEHSSKYDTIRLPLRPARARLPEQLPAA